MTGRVGFTLVLLVKIVSAGRAPASQTVDLGRLAWMAGSWAADSAGMHVEEHWTAPRSGVMLGMHRDADARGAAFEFLRIESDASGMRYLAQPQGRPATAFTVKAIGDRTVTFENKAHDYPQRILYWLGTDGSLHARTEGMVKGKARGEEWRWERAALGD